jgi:SAM-dependent methyltransferase
MSQYSRFANSAVLEFYQALPFNARHSVEASTEAICSVDHAKTYPVLLPLLRRGTRVLDVGCGTGWFSNSLAYHHGAVVTGIDFNEVAIGRARAVAAELNLAATFHVTDLFLFDPLESFDLVVSLGVLHHTNDCSLALRRICQRFVRPGGHIFIGLYHANGRKPFLDHFQSLKERGATEQEMLDRYRQLHSQITDDTLLLSWFRDQVLHPHETQHTLAEMLPVLRDTSMQLVSTSLNRFGPIEPLSALLEEERKLYDLGVQRLQANQYFPGFFLFLAQKLGAAESTASKGSGECDLAATEQVLDSKPYIEHHPIFGYCYTPGGNLELPRPDGGRYHIRVNSQGIRSDREYTLKKPKGVRRIIVCGDSMATGQFVSNAQRFTEILERRVPDLEAINLALEGSGTDQQLLLYEHVGLQYEHDIVLLLPFLQNIRRNMAEAREGYDPRSGRRVFRPKPRFELVDGKLAIRNVPVPREASPDSSCITDTSPSLTTQLKTRVSSLPGAELFKKLLYAAVPWEPFPEYRNPHSKGWQLMAALVHRFKELAGGRPLVLAPTFYCNYVRFRMARNYWRRYASLQVTPGIEVIDLLPYFRRTGPDAVRCYQEPHDMHFSASGHLVLADALQEELTKRGLLPRTA